MFIREEILEGERRLTFTIDMTTDLLSGHRKDDGRALPVGKPCNVSGVDTRIEDGYFTEYNLARSQPDGLLVNASVTHQTILT